MKNIAIFFYTINFDMYGFWMLGQAFQNNVDRMGFEATGKKALTLCYLYFQVVLLLLC